MATTDYTTNTVDIAGRTYELVAEQGDGGGQYDWSMVALIRSPEGQLFLVVDGGCSCNGPWDDTRLGDLVSVRSWQEAVDKVKADKPFLFSDADVAEFAQQLMALHPAPSA